MMTDASFCSQNVSSGEKNRQTDKLADGIFSHGVTFGPSTDSQGRQSTLVGFRFSQLTLVKEVINVRGKISRERKEGFSENPTAPLSLLFFLILSICFDSS